MKAIISGGAGFIGSHLVDTLLNEINKKYNYIIENNYYNITRINKDCFDG